MNKKLIDDGFVCEIKKSVDGLVSYSLEDQKKDQMRIFDMVNEGTENYCEYKALFFDRMVAAFKGKSIFHPIASIFAETLERDFSDVYIEQLDQTIDKSELVFSLETEPSHLAVAVGPLIDTKIFANQLAAMCSYLSVLFSFKLLSNDREITKLFDGYLKMPIHFKTEEDENTEPYDHAYGMFCIIQWFRELVNSFAKIAMNTSEEDMLFTRLDNIVELQDMLEKFIRDNQSVKVWPFSIKSALGKAVAIKPVYRRISFDVASLFSVRTDGNVKLHLPAALLLLRTYTEMLRQQLFSPFIKTVTLEEKLTVENPSSLLVNLWSIEDVVLCYYNKHCVDVTESNIEKEQTMELVELYFGLLIKIAQRVNNLGVDPRKLPEFSKDSNASFEHQLLEHVLSDKMRPLTFVSLKTSDLVASLCQLLICMKNYYYRLSIHSFIYLSLSTLLYLLFFYFHN